MLPESLKLSDLRLISRVHLFLFVDFLDSSMTCRWLVCFSNPRQIQPWQEGNIHGIWAYFDKSRCSSAASQTSLFFEGRFSPPEIAMPTSSTHPAPKAGDVFPSKSSESGDGQGEIAHKGGTQYQPEPISFEINQQQK